jgi:hypothetical protein
VQRVAYRNPQRVCYPKDNGITRLHKALFQYTQIESSSTRDEKVCHKAGIAKLDPELEARYPGLGDLHHGLPNREDIADVNAIVVWPL